MSATAEQSVQVHENIYIGGEWVPSSGSGRARGDQLDDRAGHGQHSGGHRRGRRPRRRGRTRGVRGLVDDLGAGAGGLARADLRRRSARAWSEIAALIAQEVGMPLKLSSMIQAGLPTMTFGSMPQVMSEMAWEEEVGNSLIVREPVGVVGAITPWNYPLHQIAAKVAPALAAGCTVVVKPSEVAPLNAFLLADVLDGLGLPAGVFNLVTGLGPVVGEALAAHADVDMVSFTGSTAAGRRVSEAAVGDGQARRARARRQVAQRDPRRRRPAARDHRRGLEVLPQLGPDVQRADAHAGAARAPGRGRADRRGGRARTSCPAIPSSRRRRSGRCLRRPARARARLHPQGLRGGREAGHRRRRVPRGPRARLLRAPDGLLRGDSRDDDRAGGDLRSGALDHRPTTTRTTRCGSPTTPTTASPAACGRPTRSAPSAVARRIRTGPGRDQRRRLQPARAVRRLQAVRPRPRVRPLRSRGVPAGQVDAALRSRARAPVPLRRPRAAGSAATRLWLRRVPCRRRRRPGRVADRPARARPRSARADPRSRRLCSMARRSCAPWRRRRAREDRARGRR